MHFAYQHPIQITMRSWFFAHICTNFDEIDRYRLEAIQLAVDGYLDGIFGVVRKIRWRKCAELPDHHPVIWPSISTQSLSRFGIELTRSLMNLILLRSPPLG